MNINRRQALKATLAGLAALAVGKLPIPKTPKAKIVRWLVPNPAYETAEYEVHFIVGDKQFWDTARAIVPNGVPYPPMPLKDFRPAHRYRLVYSKKGKGAVYEKVEPFIERA